MAIRLKSEFHSLAGVLWTIEVHDTDYAGSEIEFKSNDFTEQLDGEDNRFAPILTNAIDLEMLVENSNHESFINDLIDAAENQFQIVIKKDSSLHFVGQILNDIISIEDAYFPYRFRITATDGLGRLKDISYNNSGSAYTGWATFQDHIHNCLNLTGLAAQFGASDPFLKTTVNWYEDNHSVTANLDPLTVTRVQHEVYYEQDKNGNYTYTSAYDVLKSLLVIFGAQIKFSGGCYHIIQPNELENATFSVRTYAKDKTLLSAVTNANYDITKSSTNERLSGAVYQFFPALSSVSVSYNHGSNENRGTSINWKSGSESEYNLGTYKFDIPGSTIKFTSQIDYSAFFTEVSIPFDVGYFIVWRLKLQFTNQYMDREYFNYGGGNVQYVTNLKWRTDSSDYIHLFKVITEKEKSGVIDFNFETPKISGEGDVITKFEFVGKFMFDGTSLSDTDLAFNYVVKEPYFEIVENGDPAEQSDTTVSEVTNSGAPSNSVSYRIDTIIGDGPTANSPGRLQVYDGTDWVDSGAWNVGDTGTRYKIQELLIREVISGQKQSIRKMQGGIISANLEPHNLFIYDSKKYIFLRGSYGARLDQWNNVLYAIDIVRTGITALSDVEKNDKVTSPSTGYTVDSGSTDPGSVTAPGGIVQTNPDFDNEFDGNVIVKDNAVITSEILENKNIGDSHPAIVHSLPSGVDGYKVRISMVDRSTGAHGHGVYVRTSSTLTISGTGTDRNVNILLDYAFE